jgi:hypothetical protein
MIAGCSGLTLKSIAPTVTTPAATATSVHPAQRQWGLDALRGLLLVLMTLTHMPTAFSLPAGQPLGFVSAAEGFVFLSAFMVGRVHGGLAWRAGEPAMRAAVAARVRRLYLCQLGLLLLAFSAIAWLGVQNRQGGITGLLELYLADPSAAVPAALLLVYQPPLLDILPMYIAFMLLTPWCLSVAGRRGWTLLGCGSALLWLAEQWGAGAGLYAALAPWSPVPYRDLGAFHWLAWQGLWLAGLWLGARRGPWPRPPRALVLFAAVHAVLMLVWRHSVGQDPMPGVPAVAALFDKWSLGPLRVLNFSSVLVLLLAFGPRLVQTLPRLPPLELLGRHSLAVFCGHVVVALFTIAVFGSTEVRRPWTTDAVLLLGALAALLATALWLEERRRPGRPRHPVTSAGGPRPPAATAHSPRH